MGHWFNLGWQTLQWICPFEHWKIGVVAGISRQTGHSSSFIRNPLHSSEFDAMLSVNVWMPRSGAGLWRQVPVNQLVAIDAKMI